MRSPESRQNHEASAPSTSSTGTGEAAMMISQGRGARTFAAHLPHRDFHDALQVAPAGWDRLEREVTDAVALNGPVVSASRWL